ncbi:hypothetical protein MANY_35630 [Mycolicibacterium anyangense]|uniref:Lipopolysaccharide assembly protein A domain-containing protein n=1 Tax=Mycolicibacterium anyangense TaxID=1431246 RepID=A0A6N4W8E6_9MYCO|nr:lipopolysaccharide assembly protein LapA domain-containing protein [Mycolicibacterium anyangense]BBZ78226.1 hypothetical protein MANY_35630 [Mycolicibacterium anyangense]
MSTEPPVSASEPTPPGPPTSPAPPAPPVDTPKTPAQPVSEVGFTRAAALWSAIFLGLLILIVLLIFVAQNTESASFAFLGWHWTLPLGVAILGAAVGGGLIAVLGGAARIFQLRRAAKKNLKAALKS